MEADDQGENKILVACHVSFIRLDQFCAVSYKTVRVIEKGEVKDSTVLMIIIATYAVLGLTLLFVACEKIGRLCIF